MKLPLLCEPVAGRLIQVWLYFPFWTYSFWLRLFVHPRNQPISLQPITSSQTSN